MNEGIHKTAIIHPQARIAKSAIIGPYSVVHGDATIGEDVRIGSFCVIDGKTTLGDNCQVFTGAVIGSIPQDKKFKTNENVELIIGKNNVFREYVTVNPGTQEGGGKTLIGDNNLLMAYAHVAHDCVIGNNCSLANNGTLAGHVTLEDRVVVGGLAAIHQFTRVGTMSIIGGCSKVVQDIPPFSTCDGHPAKVYGLNSLGLRRSKMSAASIGLLKKAFKILFFSGLSKVNAIERIKSEISLIPEIEHLIKFAQTSKRGLCTAARQPSSDET